MLHETSKGDSLGHNPPGTALNYCAPAGFTAASVKGTPNHRNKGVQEAHGADLLQLRQSQKTKTVEPKRDCVLGCAL